MFYKKLILSAALGVAANVAVSAPSVPAGDLEAFFGAVPGAISTVSPSPSEGPAAIEGSGIRDSFEFIAGDILSFDYNFLTNERPDWGVDDYAFVSFGGEVYFLDHAQNTASGYYSASATPYNEETGYKSFSFLVPGVPVFNFGVGIVDATDDMVDSALLIDNVMVMRDGGMLYFNGFETGPGGDWIGDFSIVDGFFGAGPTEGSLQALITTATNPVPLPPAVWLLFTGIGALLGFGRRKRV